MRQTAAVRRSLIIKHCECGSDYAGSACENCFGSAAPVPPSTMKHTFGKCPDCGHDARANVCEVTRSLEADLDDVSILRDKERAENERLRTALKIVVAAELDNAEDHDPVTLSNEEFREICAALAETKG